MLCPNETENEAEMEPACAKASDQIRLNAGACKCEVSQARDAWSIFFATGLLGSGSQSYARARPGLILLVAYYEGSHILMDGGPKIDLSSISD